MGNTIFMEGFENIEPLGRQGLTLSGVIDYVTGRSGGKAITRLAGSSVVTQFDCSISGASQIIVSLAFKRTNGVGDVVPLLNLMNGSNTHAALRVNSANQLIVINTANTIVGTSAATIDPTGWNRVDFLVNVFDTGSAEVRLNGVSVLTVSADFKNVSSTEVTIVRILIGTAGSTNLAVDDLHIRNDNVFQPDMIVETLQPNGNGAFSDLVGSDGNSVDNYLLVDELPFAAADYVISATVGARDLYAHTDLATLVGVPKAVQIHWNGQKSDAGAAAIIPVMRLAAGTEWEGAPVGLATTAGYSNSEIREVDPAGNPYTVSSVNGMQFGVEIA
jgi:hypothetical protein